MEEVVAELTGPAHTVCIAPFNDRWRYYYVDRHGKTPEIWTFPQTLKEAIIRSKSLAMEVYSKEAGAFEVAKSILADEELSHFALRARRISERSSKPSDFQNIAGTHEAKFAAALETSQVTPDKPRIAVCTEDDQNWLFIDDISQRESIFELCVGDAEAFAGKAARRSTNFVWLVFYLPLFASIVILIARMF